MRGLSGDIDQGRIDAHGDGVLPQALIGPVLGNRFGGGKFPRADNRLVVLWTQDEAVGMHAKPRAGRNLARRCSEQRIGAAGGADRAGWRNCAFNSRPDPITLRQASSALGVKLQPSGIVCPTPAVIRCSRSNAPMISAGSSSPPGELKKIGRFLRGDDFRNSRSRLCESGSKVPSAAIHSPQPTPQAFGPPLATKKTIG